MRFKNMMLNSTTKKFPEMFFVLLAMNLHCCSCSWQLQSKLLCFCHRQDMAVSREFQRQPHIVVATEEIIRRIALLALGAHPRAAGRIVGTGQPAPPREQNHGVPARQGDERRPPPLRGPHKLVCVPVVLAAYICSWAQAVDVGVGVLPLPRSCG